MLQRYKYKQNFKPLLYLDELIPFFLILNNGRYHKMLLIFAQNNSMEIIFQTWSWYVSGFNWYDHAGTTYFGKAFGMSICVRFVLAGLGKRVAFRF
jgi:hypothetical protein